MKNFKIYSGYISLIISLIALGISLVHSNERGYDNMMFAIAVLAILVTVLIGWNIFNVLSFKEDVSKELLRQKEELHTWINKANEGVIRVNNSLMVSMYMAFNKDNEGLKDFIYLDYGIKAISGHVTLGNYASAQRIIDQLISKTPSMPPIIIEHKVSLINQLEEVEKMLEDSNIQDIQRLPFLKSHVLSLGDL